ncbi:hypothetical protein HY405_00675 [Candidatus Microgenomates bacterium]|nr:hypothetical protein [Candidatus Microgenomates bacterium]
MPKLLKSVNVAVHTVIVFLLYTSPFWLDWKLIIPAIILNYTQMYIFGGCILTNKQFENVEISFHEWLLSKARVSIKNRLKFLRFLRWQLPFIILALAILWQELLGMNPLIKI